MRIRNRYKDATLDLKWAKPKIRKMIDTYLESVGIYSKVPPVSLLSDDFINEMNKVGGNKKARASEMEHAIRRHIKVNMDKDPGMYKGFLKRMEEILEKYKENWNQILEEFDNLRSDLDRGRKSEGQEEGLSEQELPFYDIIKLSVYKDDKVPEGHKEEVKKLIIEVVEQLQDAINKPNFWQGRKAEIRALQGTIEDIFDYCSLEEVSNKSEKLTIDIMSLAQKRHQELTS